jgi:hypothetical protein
VVLVVAVMLVQTEGTMLVLQELLTLAVVAVAVTMNLLTLLAVLVVRVS